MCARFLPGAIDSLELVQPLAVALARVLDRLFDTRDFCTDGIKLALHGITVVGGLRLLTADTLDLCFDSALVCNRTFQLHLLRSDGAIGLAHLGVERSPTQCQPLRPCQAFLTLELFISLGGA